MPLFRQDGWVKSATGPAVSGASIYVCSQPTTDTTDIPPAPLATIFSDPNGVDQITQPIITDGLGHFDYYAASGFYTLVVVYAGNIQVVYPDQTVAGVVIAFTAGTGISIVGTTINNTGVLSVNGLSVSPVIAAGAGVSVTVASPNITIANTGVLSINGLTGAPSVIAGTGISITPSGSSITVTNTSPASSLTPGTGIGISGTTISNTGVTTFNTLTGAVTISAGTGISLTPSGNNIAIANTATGPLFPSAGLRVQFGGPVGAGTTSFATPFSGTPVVVLGNIHGSVDIDDSSINNNGFTLSVSSGSTACYVAIGPA